MVAAGAFAVTSCGRGNLRPARPRDFSPAQTLYEFKLAYNAPDMNLYRELFVPQTFRYEPEKAPADFPETWGYDEEMAATAAIFAEAYHAVLDFDATAGAVGTPPLGATVYETPPLEVTLRVWENADRCFYARGPVTFTLGRPDTGGKWRITRIADKTGPDRAKVKPNAQTVVCGWMDVKFYYLKKGHTRGDS